MSRFVADNMGASQVMINTEKGKALFDEIAGEYRGHEISLEDGMQPNMEHPSNHPGNHDVFLKELEKGTLESAAWAIASRKGKMKLVINRLGLSEMVYRIKRRI